MSNLDKFRRDFERLSAQSNRLALALMADFLGDTEAATVFKGTEGQRERKALKGEFRENYQLWYTEASAVVRQLLPERHAEFIAYYLIDPKRKEVGISTYRIQDWMNCTTSAKDYSGTKYFNDTAILISCFGSQCEILKACKVRFESSLLDIRQVLQADLFDSEVDVARELHKKGFGRSAGALCGVVLERHLAQVAESRAIAIGKKHPTIADLNDPLKSAGVYDMPVWRHIQHLADIRNLCSHSKDREPTKDEVTELIDGTSKITKTVY